jgi:2-dehydro-3-deoxyphosphooctonate aldolase (KDO 8-P synthase)
MQPKMAQPTHRKRFSYSDTLFFIAGPCVIEDRHFALETAEELKTIFESVHLPFIYKSSFDKANRSSIDSFRGLGLDQGLSILAEIGDKLDLPVLTDVHEPWQEKIVAEAVDVMQIPALLCRQTDLITAVAETGKPVNFKKGQFLSPWEMKNVIDKARLAARQAGKPDDGFLVCERGTFFGYNNLVVDMRSAKIMSDLTGCPVVFDATHSVQLPGASGTRSGGQREFIPGLARAAIATGAISGIFMETHPNPEHAPCDGPNMLSLKGLPALLMELKNIYQLIHGNSPCKS